MDNLDIFEDASKYFLEKMTEFKEILSSKVDSLNNKDWILSKGSTKTCKADETGKKKRCKVGLNYGLKIELSVDDVDIIWNEFSSFFTSPYPSFPFFKASSVANFSACFGDILAIFLSN